MKNQKIYDVPKGVTEIHVDDGLHYCLFMKGGEPEFISISGSEDNAKRIAELEAELADLKESVRHLISDAHISGFVLEGGGKRSIMYFVKGELIDDLKRSLIQDDDK